MGDKQSRRKDLITAGWLPGGKIRFYLNNKRKAGVSEMAVADCKGSAYALICGNINLVLLDYEL